MHPSDHAHSAGGLWLLLLPCHQLFWWRQRNHSAHSSRYNCTHFSCSKKIQLFSPHTNCRYLYIAILSEYRNNKVFVNFVPCRAPRPPRGGDQRSEGQDHCTALDYGFRWEQPNHRLWYWEQEQVRYKTRHLYLKVYGMVIFKKLFYIKHWLNFEIL